MTRANAIVTKDEMLQRWRERSRELQLDVHAIYLASKDPRVPWYAKALALVVAGYMLSPIDLIPDFIPVLGYLDDLIIVPAGLILVVKLIPPEVLAEHRETARRAGIERKASRVAAAFIVVTWVLLVITIAEIVYFRLHSR